MKLELEMSQVERVAQLRESQEEISTLRNTIEELLASKTAVVTRLLIIHSFNQLTYSLICFSVNHVMEDNKNLREKLHKVLNKDGKANSPTFSSIFFTKNSNSPGK